MCARASNLPRHPRLAEVLLLKHLKEHEQARAPTLFLLELAAATWSQVEVLGLLRHDPGQDSPESCREIPAGCCVLGAAAASSSATVPGWLLSIL